MRRAAAYASRLLRRLSSPYVLSAILMALYVALVVLVSSVAHAQSADQVRSQFAAADTNHDGRLTLAEAQARAPRIAARFSQIDTQKKGYITLDELLAALARR